MLMEHNVLRSNWSTMGEHDYPAGTHPTVEQQHFPSLAPSFHSYGAYAAAPLQRFKDEASPRTFGSLYPQQQQATHAYQHAAPHSSNGSSGSNNDSHYFHSHQHHPYSSSVLGSQLPLPHHHALPLSLSIPRPSGIATTLAADNSTISKKASEEERKAKHREAQRRFVKRKKAEMTQLKQFAVELELQYQLCEVLNECAALERANSSLEHDIEAARDQAVTKQEEQGEPEPERPPIKLPELKFDYEW